MQQLKKNQGGSTMSTWAKNKSILQDQAVDAAMEKARTSSMYKKYIEQKGKEWAQQGMSARGKRVDSAPTMQDGAEEDGKQREAELAQTIEDDELAELERQVMGDELDDDKAELEKLQHRRKAELKREWKKKQIDMSAGSGRYEEMDERELLKMASKGGQIVVHFYASGIDLGKIMDEHLRRIAPRHTEARFVKLDARKSPFLVAHWKVRTLPTLACIVNGYLADKIIGFDELGGKEDFPTVALVRRLAKSGVIKDPEGKIKGKGKRTKLLTDLMD